jgi:hypothetical protein
MAFAGFSVITGAAVQPRSRQPRDHVRGKAGGKLFAGFAGGLTCALKIVPPYAAQLADGA